MRILLIVDPCDGGTLESEAACFRELATNDKDAAIVWYLWNAVQACASYSSDLDTLLSAGACLAVEPPEMLHAMEVQLAGNAAVAAGSSVSVTIAEVTEGIKCLKQASPAVIRALRLLLLCKLNACIS